MVDDVEKPRPHAETKPRCPACAAFPRLLHAILEPSTGKTVRLYQCECRERIWRE